MHSSTQYAILKAHTAEALAEIVRHAIRNKEQQALGHPFLIIRPDGTAFCLQVLASLQSLVVVDNATAHAPARNW
jgi:hypothetical protein